MGDDRGRGIEGVVLRATKVEVVSAFHGNTNEKQQQEAAEITKEKLSRDEQEGWRGRRWEVCKRSSASPS